MTHDPFADDQDALNRPKPPLVSSNAYCSDCEVRWRVDPKVPEWPCWCCGRDCRDSEPTYAGVDLGVPEGWLHAYQLAPGMLAGLTMVGCDALNVSEEDVWAAAWQRTLGRAQ